MRRLHLKYWHKTYLASLALAAGLLAALFAVLQISCRQSFAARVDELLTRQHALVTTVAEDTAAVLASRPDALAQLWSNHGQSARGQGLGLGIFRNGEAVYSSLPTAEPLPEITTLVAGQRSWQVRMVEGGHLFYATTALAGDLIGYTITMTAPIEDFYTEWQRIAAVCAGLGTAAAGAFALGLYLVLRRLSRPLQTLTEAARSMAGGDYTRRATAPGAPRTDEVGELGRALDELAATVDAQLKTLSTEAEAKQRLVDDLSHEMRTPLTAIGGYAEYIQRADLRGSELQEALDTIRFESGRLLNLSQQLVRLSVLRQEPPELTEQDAAALLRRAAKALRPKAAARGVALHCETPEALPAIQGEAALLESLVVNLGDNAIKACAAGGTVTLAGAAAADGGCALTVTDNGRGMDAGTLARIGQPFYRADKARARAEGGAGLGVALCRSITAAHGAQLQYESEPGRGTRATVTFPPAAAFTTSQQVGDKTVIREG